MNNTFSLTKATRSADAEGLQSTFITRNNKSDLQTHSRSLAIMPFDRPYMISY